ncbi:MAG: WYL domain-containing protein [Chitinophagaceae bacterium]|nr:MAG: WYL domain-containing protein [Chitinophagaceae bacterium]
MSAHQKIYRIFNVISRLRSPIGCSKERMAADFDVNVRTIERYFELLRDIGFNIEKKGPRFFINKLANENLKYENFIIFSLEEASLVKECLLNHSGQSVFKNSLLQKLYALTEIDEITDEFYLLNISKNISEIRNAIKEKKQIILKNYTSVNSESEKDRCVEPIRLIQYCRYLLAFEPESNSVKQFKIERIQRVENTGKNWTNEKNHQTLETDIFGMNGEKSYQIQLKLSLRAYSLLTEEFPGSERYIKRSKKNIYFTPTVNSFKGIGRFTLGLIDEIEVIESDEFKNYLSEKLKKVL